MKNYTQQRAKLIAKDLPGHNEFVSVSFNVYNVDEGLKIIAVGILSLEYAEKIAQDAIKNGVHKVSIVICETQVRVVRQIQSYTGKKMSEFD